MSVHAGSFRRLLTHGWTLPMLLVSVGCDAQQVESSLVDRGHAVAGYAAAGNAVIRWNAVASELMVDPGPVVNSRAFAILHAAIHDAVNAIERRYEPYTANDLSSPGASIDAAVAAAARDVLMALSPSKKDAIERAYIEALAAVPDGPAKDDGVDVGRMAARANLARRAGDEIPVGPWPPVSGPITQPVYVPTGEPGDYAFTPPFDRRPLGPIALFPGWGRLEPFGTDPSKHPLPGPDALDSDAYARDVELLQSVGSLHSSTRTDDQTKMAFFWFEELVTWNDIGRSVLEEQNADVWLAARTLALLHFAMADGGIASFEGKYRFRFWRPITAIRRADEDGNPATQPDPEWRPLLWTPLDIVPPTFFTPPIPDYPSTAATIAAAAAEALIGSLGDRHDFEATSPFLPGVTRRFSSFTQAADENGLSRVYGGIHFLRAVRDGAALGRAIGRDVSLLLLPARQD